MKLAENPQAYAIMGCAMRVHATLGGGFLESAYGDALEIEFAKSDIPFVREDEITIVYQGHPLKTTYRADFTCFGRSFLVELKAVKEITGVEKAQVLHYMKATGIRFALLINFANEKLQYDAFDAEELKKSSPLPKTFKRRSVSAALGKIGVSKTSGFEETSPNQNSDESDASATASDFETFEKRSVSEALGKIGVSNNSEFPSPFPFD